MEIYGAWLNKASVPDDRFVSIHFLSTDAWEEKRRNMMIYTGFYAIRIVCRITPLVLATHKSSAL